MVTFLLAIFLGIFIPGDLVVETFKLPRFARMVLALGVGLVFWAIQGFTFGFLHLRFLTYGYIAVCFVSWIWLKRWR